MPDVNDEPRAQTITMNRAGEKIPNEIIATVQVGDAVFYERELQLWVAVPSPGFADLPGVGRIDWKWESHFEVVR